MSYILDALKRSERERRGQGRAKDPLLEGAAPSPAPSRPLWPVLLGLALLANAGVLAGYLLLREPASPPPPHTAAPVRQAPAAQPSPPQAPPRTQEAPSPARTEGPAQPPDPPPPASASPEPPRPAAPADAEPPPQQAATRSAPAAEPSASPAPASPSAPWESLPYLEELPAEFRSSVPEMTVDVHVFTDDPARRFILLDLRRYREGDQLPSGARLLHITPEGIALAWQGRRFRLGTR